MKTAHYFLLPCLIILFYSCKSNHTFGLEETIQEGELLYSLDRTYDAGLQLWNSLHQTGDSSYSFLLTYMVNGDGHFSIIDTTCTYSLLTGVVDSITRQVKDHTHKVQPLSNHELKLLAMHLKADTAFRRQSHVANGASYRILAYDHPKFGRRAYLYPVVNPSLLLWGPDCSFQFGDTLENFTMDIVHAWEMDRTDDNKDPHHTHPKHHPFLAADYFRLRAAQNMVPWKQYRIVGGDARQSWTIDMQTMEITPSINPH